jgi:hypothetical protein
MDKEEFCDSCHQKHDCREVYRRLGRTQGPSVALQVLTAFVLPMVVFVVCLAALEVVLANGVASGKVRTAVSLVGAVSATLVCIFATKAVNNRAGRDK